MVVTKSGFSVHVEGSNHSNFLSYTSTPERYANSGERLANKEVLDAQAIAR